MKKTTLCIFIDDFCCCASWKGKGEPDVIFSSRILVESDGRENNGAIVPKRIIVRRVGLPVDYEPKNWKKCSLYNVMIEPKAKKLAAYLAALIEACRRQVDPALEISSVSVAVPRWGGRPQEALFNTVTTWLTETFNTKRNFPARFVDAHVISVEDANGDTVATLCQWERGASVKLWKVGEDPTSPDSTCTFVEDSELEGLKQKELNEAKKHQAAVQDNPHQIEVTD